MKKTTAVILCLLLTLSLCACSINISVGSNNKSDNSDDSSAVASEASSSDVQQESVSVNDSFPSGSYPEPQSRYNSINEIDFSQYKVILVNFWRPTCGFCVKEMPDFEQLWQEYKDKGLLIVGISTESNDVDATISDTGVTYPIIIDENYVRDEITNVMPQTAFFDSDWNLLSAQPSEVDDMDEDTQEGFFEGYADYSTWRQRVESRLYGDVPPSDSTTARSMFVPGDGQTATGVNNHPTITGVLVQNDLFSNIIAFYMKPSESGDWGDNWIHEGGSYDAGRVSFAGSIDLSDEGYLHDILFMTDAGVQGEFDNLNFAEAEDIDDVTIYLRYNNDILNVLIG